MLYADVIVDISVEALDKTYQYSVPECYADAVGIGKQVIIPFGTGNRRLSGYITGLSHIPKIDPSRIKDICEVPEKSVAIEGQMISLAAWIRENFGSTMNDALKVVMPVKQKIKELSKREIVATEDVQKFNAAVEEAARKKYAAKVRLLSALKPGMAIPYTKASDELEIPKSTVESLEKQGIIKVTSEKIYRDVIEGETEENVKIQLNEEQRRAVEGIESDYDSGKRATYLLHGVTGSGKTEVFLDVIEHVVKNGRQVIMLIPEISLTYQTVRRFKRRFGDRISVLNSKLSAGERYDQYLKAKEGLIDVIIGPRSALFAPFERLGLIVIDEEHESSYKSENTPKYHARETAIERARMAGASVILASATPSLESYKKALSGEYILYELTQRANDAKLPQVHIVDLKEELARGNKSVFSLALAERIKDRLDKKEQIMLFINRRGYAGFVSCRSCGKAIKCPHCDVSLKLHYDNRLRCHYCGYEVMMPNRCPSCSSPYIAGFGTGTQKIEELVKKYFPMARTLRMDADTTKEKDSYNNILSKFAAGEADILIGTQMIVKGHDFPKVTLVGILAADLSLNVNDFRASEKTFELLAQAAGRAGRSSLAGDVVIQTYQPEHYSIVTAAKQDYKEFYKQEIAYRNILSYPPEAYMSVMLVQGKNEEETRKETERLRETAKKWLEQNEGQKTVLLGPVPAGVSKINDYYRFLLYARDRNCDIIKGLNNYLVEFVTSVDKERNKNINIQFDVNPLNSY